MSYDLAVWEGDRPADDEDGTKFYREHIVPQLENYDPRNPVPPAPRIRAYVEALLERWPDITTDDDGSPWATGPLIGEAVGWFIYFPMVWSAAEEASAFAAEVARQHGLVCYDLSKSGCASDRPPPSSLCADVQQARYRTGI